MNIQHFFTIGADPEVFLQDSQGKHVSAVGLVGGTKRRPRPIDLEGNALQEDNVAVEFNTAVAADAKTFAKHVAYNLNAIRTLLPAHKLSTLSAFSFSTDQLDTPQAQMFGCEPDINAWTGKINAKPFCEDPNLRSAGGHIHIGAECARTHPLKLIQACDLFLGVPSVVKDPSHERRSLYGKAGACRVKPFGVEYRTLSNFWIFTDENIEWVYTQVAKAVSYVTNGYSIEPCHRNTIQKCINTSDIGMVYYLSKRYEID